MPSQVTNNSHGQAAAKGYYDSDDANKFYMHCWGGENIHVGLYKKSFEENTVEDVKEASIASVESLIDCIPASRAKTIKRVADLGSGIGGGARAFCRRFPEVVVDCYEIATKENDTNKRLSAESGFADRINVFEKSYLETGVPDNTYDVVTAQDAFLHCTQREELVAEICRICKPGGIIVFSDLMQTHTADTSKLKPIYERLCLTDMCSRVKYEEYFRKHGFRLVKWIDNWHNMRTHYATVRKLLLEKGKACGISDEYINSASKGLTRWVEAITRGDLNWGFMVFVSTSSL